MEREMSNSHPSRRRSPNNSNIHIDVPSLAPESTRINVFSHAIVALRQHSFKDVHSWTTKTIETTTLYAKTAHVVNTASQEQLQPLLTQLHPIDDFFAYISVLHAILAQIDSESTHTNQLLSAYKSIVDATNPNWAKAAHTRWIGAGRHVVRLAIHAHHSFIPLSLLNSLQIAVDKLSPTPDHLVSLQADFLALCLSAKSFRFAYRWIKQYVRLQVDPIHTGITASDIHLIYHYSAIISAALQDFHSALQYCKLALAVPAPVPGPFFHVATATYRYCILLNLLVGGSLSSSLKFSSYIPTRMRKATIEYIDLASAFEDCNTQEVLQIFRANRACYEKHGTLSLVKKVVEDLPKRLLRRLASSYVTMSLDDVARELSLSDAKEAHSMILDMIKTGSINASIDDKTGIVRISERDEGEDDCFPADITNEHMKQCLQVVQRIDEFREKLEQNPAYVVKEMKSQSGRMFNGGFGRSSFGMGDVDAEFLR